MEITQKLIEQNKLQKKEIEDLKNRLNLYKTVAENTYDWEYWIDNDNNIKYISTSCERITGYLPEDFKEDKKLIYRIIHPDDRDSFLNHKHNVNEKGYRIPIEFRIIRKDGKIAWIGHTCQNVNDGNDNLIGIKGCNRLITARKQNEKVLKESERMRKNAQRIAKIGNWELNLVSNELSWSDEIYRIFEIDKKKFKESYKAFLNAIHPEDREIVDNTYKQSLIDKQPYCIEHRLLMSDGRIKHVYEQCETEYSTDGTALISRGTVQDITRRKNTEMELLQSENQLQLIFDNSPAIMLLLDKNAEILKINKTGLDLADSSFEGVKNKSSGVALNCINALHDIPTCGVDVMCGNCLIRKAIMDTIKNKIPHHKSESKFIVQKSDAQVEYTVLVSTIVASEYPETTVLVTLDDITERKKNELRLAKLSSIVEQSSSTIIITDLEGNIEYVNPAFETITGYTIEEAKGKNPKILKSNILNDNIYIDLWNTITNGKVWKGRFINKRKNGKNYHENAIISPIIDNEGNIVNYFAIKEDITKQVEAEKALKESEERFNELFQNMSNGCAVYRAVENGEDFVILDFNKGAEKMEGVQKKDLIGKKITNAFPGVKEFGLFSIMQKVYKTGRPEHFPITFYEDNRLQGWRENYVYRLSNNDIVAVYEDKTKEKEAELNFKKQYQDLIIAKEKSEKSEEELKLANATKDIFFNIIAHDLRSPFNAIIGFLNMFQEMHAKLDVQKREQQIIRIIKNVNRVYKLLENLLNWSKSQSGRLKFLPDKHEMQEIVAEALLDTEEAAKAKGINISSVIAESFSIYCDKEMIKTILRNLITNSIKFTQKEGSIIIKAFNDDDYTTILVKDTGVGISKEKIEKFFDITKKTSSLGTEKEIGTGLGLILCKEFVEMHSGEINIDSEEGKGSTFSVTIPRNVSKVEQ